MMNVERRTMRVAVGQLVARLGDVDGNIAEACRLSREAALQGARLIVLPEGCLTGNALASPARQATLPMESTPFKPLLHMAEACDISICAGFATPYGDTFNIVHAVIQPGRRLLFQRKATRASTEPVFLAPWPDPVRTPFVVDGIPVVVIICSEMGGGAIMAATARCRPRLILHPSAGSMKPSEVLHPGQVPTPEALAFDENCRRVVEGAAIKVREHGVARIGGNPVGFDGETWWPGNSYGIDAAGNIVLWLKGANRPAEMSGSILVADMPL